MFLKALDKNHKGVHLWESIIGLQPAPLLNNELF